jgi:hypothetical protein
LFGDFGDKEPQLQSNFSPSELSTLFKKIKLLSNKLICNGAA